MKDFVIAVLISFVAWTTGLMGAIVYCLTWVLAAALKKAGTPLDMDGAMLLVGAAYGCLATTNAAWLMEVAKKSYKPPS